MKSKISATLLKILTLATLLLTLPTTPAHAEGPPAPGDTTQPAVPASPATFFATVQSWATSQNTNNLWSTKGSLSAGVDTIQNSKVNLANNIRLSYEVTSGLALEAGFRDSGVAGVMVSVGGGLAWHIKMNDLQIMPYINGGYDRVNTQRLFGEVGIRAEKKMTKYTFIGVSIGQQFPTDRRIYSAYTGFTF